MGIGLGTALAIGGTAVSAVGTLRQGKAAEKNAEYNAAMDDFNAEYAEQKAKFDEKLLREDEARTKGSARAIMGASGFAMDEGSNVDVIDDIGRSFAIDASIIRSKGKLDSYSYRSSAGTQRWQGKQARSASRINAFSGMLTSGSQIYDQIKRT